MTKQVLIVDDSPTMRMSVKNTLEMGKYRVSVATNGFEALAQLEQGLVPSLIITDINMPGMTGFELIPKIKMMHKLRFVPILTLTTESDPKKRDQGRAVGATGWLVKPVSAEDLLAVIQRVVPA